ncbi:uncharacterized protein LOC112164453 [Rosa chinensis]|uniref:uncharacterized protein LOC112164453 n=1 Tax=Rosa chinensis TaxID=74649 RepID=UPI000D08ED42|nr:uncharacterized protein LOC112164453 [Rosa chinensis]
MVQHMRPLYITANVSGTKVSKIMVDTGAAVNVITTRTMHLLGIKREKIQSTSLTLKNFAGTVTKTLGLLFLRIKVGPAEGVYAFFVTDCYAAYSAILGRDWIHRSYCVPSTLHQELVMWNRKTDKAEVIKADPRPFPVSANYVDARYYLEPITPLQEQDAEVDVQLAPAALDDTPPKVKDPTEKINLGTADEPMEVAISAYLEPSEKQGLIELLHEFKDCFTEKYEDMPVVKSQRKGDHITDLRKVFERIRQHKLKMNPAKCVFGVRAGDFLGFIVHQRGIEVPEDKASAVINATAPRTKKELQRLLGKIQPFSPLLKLQGQAEFVWEPKHQEAFDRIKTYLASPPVLVPPRAGIPLKLYISATEASIGSLLAQDDEGGIEHAIFYLSQTLTDCETSVQVATLHVILYYLHHRSNGSSQIHVIAAYFERPHWQVGPRPFRISLQYVPQKAVKGQAIADFLAHHLTLEIPTAKELEIATETLAGAGIVLENPTGDRFSYSFQLEFKCTNNQAEYEALIIGLEVLLEMGVRDVQIRGDSQLVINQLQNVYRCASWLLMPYLNRAIELLDQFTDVDLEHIPRERNFAANELAQLATGITLKYGVRERLLKVERRTLPSWLARPDSPDDPVVAVLEPIDVDWRIPLVAYLKRPDPTADRKIRFLALNYLLRGDELRRRGEDGMDFRCVYGREAKRLMREAHTGICGAHQAGPKMRWLIRRHGYYWPSILKDCIAFAKGCEDCQAHGPVQHVPNIPMQPIIKPWPARGWALDLIGMIHPHSSLQHKFIIVATDFFTKWVEAEPLKEASGCTIRQFIFRNILCRFGVPEVLVSDRGGQRSWEVPSSN